MLDFKREPIWKNDEGKTKLAIHIAAFANRSGGLIVGVDEGTGAEPACLVPIADLNTDGEELTALIGDDQRRTPSFVGAE